MRAQDVMELLEVQAAAGAETIWVDGGWGVDALLHTQTRAHRDLDRVVWDIDLHVVRAAAGGVVAAEDGG